VNQHPHWIELNRPIYHADPLYCHACGAMIPRRYWQPGGGETNAYCTPRCHAVEARVDELLQRWREP
jgi:hypothetical protein